MPALRADDFWSFALAHYARPGVAEICLQLQDAHGADVNLLLLGLWLETLRLAWHDGDLDRLEAIAREWRQSLAPLRQARRALKHLPDAEALYAQAKSLELAVERAVQQRLLRDWQPSGRPPEKGGNLPRYLARLTPPPAPETLRALRADTGKNR